MNTNNSVPHSNRTWLEKLVFALTGEPSNRDDLVAILHDATENNLINPNSLGMIEGVLDVHELRVKEIMIPRSQMVTIDDDIPLAEIITTVIDAKHSRFPVIGENKDEILGILLAKDLLAFLHTKKHGNKFNLRDILRSATFIPESKRLDVLLQDFKISRNHMAIVADEYGGVTGLITIEDVLEQIVGDIADEHDIDEEHFIKKHRDNTYYIQAVTTIEEFNEYFNAEFTNDDVETIGGLLIRNFGHLPKKNETIEINDILFKVLRADSRRIHLLQATPKTAIHHEQ